MRRAGAPSSSTTCRTPAPSCITISGSERSSATVTVCPASDGRAGTRARPRRGRTARRTPRRRRAAPTMPSSSSRSATRSTTACVSCTSSATRTAGLVSLELAEELRHDDRRGPGRGAERELAERSSDPAVTSSTRCSSSASSRCRRGRAACRAPSARHAARAVELLREPLARAPAPGERRAASRPSASAACEKLLRSTTRRTQQADACP